MSVIKNIVYFFESVFLLLVLFGVFNLINLFSLHKEKMNLPLLKKSTN